eukprot:359537-Chlamydomonas_euryale.AAC.1
MPRGRSRSDSAGASTMPPLMAAALSPTATAPSPTASVPVPTAVARPLTAASPPLTAAGTPRCAPAAGAAAAGAARPALRFAAARPLAIGPARLPRWLPHRSPAATWRKHARPPLPPSLPRLAAASPQPRQRAAAAPASAAAPLPRRRYRRRCRRPRPPPAACACRRAAFGRGLRAQATPGSPSTPTRHPACARVRS